MESDVSVVARVIAQLGRALADAPDIAVMYLFGSHAKGRAHPGSDVDVAILFREAVSGTGADLSVLDRALSLGAFLERELRVPVDVVPLNTAPLDLTHNVLSHGRLVLCRDESVRRAFYVQHARAYHDMAHAREIFRRAMARRIEEGTFGGGVGNRPEAA